MASRTKQKEQARARRLAEERARLEREQRARRLRMLAGVVVAAVAVIVVVIVISVSGSSPTAGPAPGTAGAKHEAATVNSLLAGIPQSGQTVGSPSAPVTIIEYGDLECPICRDFALGSETQLISHDVRAGKVKLVYKSFESATPNPSTFTTQQAAAYAAGLQGKAWNYILLFYHEQGTEGSGYVNASYLGKLARQIPGLNYSQWQSQLGNSSLISRVRTEEQQGVTGSFGGTPTIILQGPKGQTNPVSGSIPYSSLEAGIKEVS